MIRYPIVLAAALAVAPAAAAEIGLTAEGPVVELSIHESVETRPDTAEIGAGVMSEGVTAIAAMQDNARAMSAVIDRIEGLGIAERDIQTAGITLNPMYDYNEESRRQIFRGYQVSNRVQVRMRDIERVGEVLDELVAAGANNLSGPNWSIDDPTAAQAQARERAMVSARERALEYARLAGYADVRLLQVSEAVPSERPMPMMRVVAAEAQGAATPVEPGMVEAGVTINVSYELISAATGSAAT